MHCLAVSRALQWVLPLECLSPAFVVLQNPAVLDRSVVQWRALNNWVFNLLLCCILPTPVAREKKKKKFMRELLLGSGFPARNRLAPSPHRNQSYHILYPRFSQYKTKLPQPLHLQLWSVPFVLVHSVFSGLGFKHLLHSESKASRKPWGTWWL